MPENSTINAKKSIKEAGLSEGNFNVSTKYILSESKVTNKLLINTPDSFISKSKNTEV
ncbi:hypothetical protein EPICR_20385 [Candidatus Desulfarcum epimagneticum]|uniref:Uncharacterized protein n=1 Tax=uncultured Desulfobacteraceae bacterium TaxID=218296 RepID=A0A484HK12_9BACT|nr:hypothetical protein EPICR_20385 [uncultured Desulfobacteraceae bacterium]